MVESIAEMTKRLAGDQCSEELLAAYHFVESMVPRSDEKIAKGPLDGFSLHGDARFGPYWHGWALREAFLAGIKYAEHARRWKRIDGSALPCDRCGKPAEWLDKFTMNEMVYCKEHGPK